VIVGVASWRGLGATTTAVALAASWAARGRRPWLVEADPAGGVLAARFASGALVAGTLEQVAFPEARSSAVERFDHAAIHHAGMRIVTAPGDPFRAWACHGPRVPWAAALRELDGPVVVDLGRLRGAGPVQAVLGQLDSLLLLADADVVSVVSTMAWAEALGRSAPADPPMLVDRTRIAMVDAPTAHDRIGRTDAVVELGDRFAGRLPWEPDTVRALFAGIRLDDRRLRRSSLVPSVHHLADRLADWSGDEVAA
jgi:hypothetical protein